MLENTGRLYHTPGSAVRKLKTGEAQNHPSAMIPLQKAIKKGEFLQNDLARAKEEDLRIMETAVTELLDQIEGMQLMLQIKTTRARIAYTGLTLKAIGAAFFQGTLVDHEDDALHPSRTLTSSGIAVTLDSLLLEIQREQSHRAHLIRCAEAAGKLVLDLLSPREGTSSGMTWH